MFSEGENSGDSQHNRQILGYFDYVFFLLFFFLRGGEQGKFPQPISNGMAMIG